jgi:tripartite-type tricarboxylate transporter receptor subunit TctC
MNSTIRRRSLVLCGLGALCAGPLPSQAEDYPARPIKLVVPFAAGGVTDLAARVLADQLARELKQAVIVENRVGAGGMIGADVVAKAQPDGYTLLFTNLVTHGMLSTTSRHLNYKPEEDFAPIALVASYPILLVTRLQLPARNVAELVALARSKPGQLTYSSAGTGSGAHFLGAQLESMAGISLTHAPYKGAAPALQDVMSGIVDFTFDGAAKSAIDAGKVRLLASASSYRDPRFPNVPTIAESGYKGFGTDAWQGLLAPGRTPAPVLAKLNAATNAAIQHAWVRDKFKDMGMVTLGGPATRLQAQIHADIERFRRIAADSKLNFD